MTSLKRFTALDLFRNLDPLTETYNIAFYLTYLSQWPDYCVIATSSSNSVMGYILGKAEGDGELWHGHVTAVTVAPEYRRMGLARKLMNVLEQVSIEIYDGYFVDLFVRASNSVAIGMYESFGYSIYRTVLEYYAGDDSEDAYGNCTNQRHEKGSSKRCTQEKYHSTQTSNKTRRVGMVIKYSKA